MNPEIIGTIAATLSTVASIPQVIKILREKNTTSISLLMYVINAASGVMWLTYGIMIDSQSLIVGNTICLSLNIMILLMKLRHG